jgi:hypothetical protein
LVAERLIAGPTFRRWSSRATRLTVQSASRATLRVLRKNDRSLRVIPTAFHGTPGGGWQRAA